MTNGSARGLVIATGMDSEFGRIATMTQAVDKEVTPLQEKLTLLGKQLGFLAISISVLVALTGWLLGNPLLEMFMTGISLAVAVVPEGTSGGSNHYLSSWSPRHGTQACLAATPPGR